MVSIISHGLTVTSWGRIEEDGRRIWRARSGDRMVEFMAAWDAETTDLLILGKAALEDDDVR